MTTFATHVGQPNPCWPRMYGRSFLKELDFSVAEWRHLLSIAADLKADKRAGHEHPRLRGRNIALVFEKTSTRTRCAFEVAAHDQGAHLTYLDPTGSQLGHKESIRDTARVLGRMYDAIEYRGFAQSAVEQLAEASKIPVWNGLTNEWHPTQSLCDMMTMTEHHPQHADRISFAYLGDARNNVANSLMDGVHGLVLAAETAVGRDPVGIVDMVTRMVRAFEWANLGAFLEREQQANA